MKKCTLLGHGWSKAAEGVMLRPHLWKCDTCGVTTKDYIEPPRWPWLYGYPMENQ